MSIISVGRRLPYRTTGIGVPGRKIYELVAVSAPPPKDDVMHACRMRTLLVGVLISRNIAPTRRRGLHQLLLHHLSHLDRLVVRAGAQEVFQSWRGKNTFQFILSMQRHRANVKVRHSYRVSCPLCPPRFVRPWVRASVAVVIAALYRQSARSFILDDLSHINLKIPLHPKTLSNADSHCHTLEP